VSGFKFGERFLEAIKSGVRVIVVVGGFRDSWNKGERTSLGTKLKEQLFEFESFIRWKRPCAAEPLLDLRDGVLDHEGTLTRSPYRVTFEIAAVIDRTNEPQCGRLLA
jgi:hypothetical protein